MAEGYWSKHHTGVIQCFLALYCAVLGTLEYVHSLSISKTITIPSSTDGAGMTHGYSMPLYLLVGIIALCLSVAIPAIVKMIQKHRVGTSAQADPQTSGVIPGIPTLSALLGQNPILEFDAKKFFALAYYSPLTAEIEKNMKIVAQQNFPNDREAFYARFIGVGYIAYQHDVSWFTIWGSQLRAMEEMNSRGLIPFADLKKHYDKAGVDYPKTFENYSFDQWLGFMKSRLLIATYPSQMAELSWGGKDFLKYLAHMAWNTNDKPN